MLTIEKIEGNSRVGVPVFSAAGKKSNYTILIFQPTYEEKKEMLFRNKEAANSIKEDITHFKDMARLLMKEKVTFSSSHGKGTNHGKSHPD